MSDIFELGYNALKLTQKAGADEVDIFCIKGKAITIDIQRNVIDLAKESRVSGIGIRAIVNGAVGFSSTNDHTKIKNAAELAVKSAKVRGKDPEWSGLPEKKKPAKVKGIYDRKVAEIEIEECIKHAQNMIKGASSISDIIPTSGSFSCADSSTLILNSHGVEIKEEETVVNGFIDSISKTLSSASEFDISRSLNIDFYKIGEKSAQLAYNSQNGININTKDTIVLLQPLAFSEILENTLFSSLNADNVQKGRSSLIGKINEEITSSQLSIIDDATLNGGIGTSSSDDEGTPSQKNEIIKNGVLLSYLYDCYTAGKEKRESTGNALRSSFTSTPTIGERNMIIKHPSFDVIGETKDGIIVNSVIGAHTANPISGDFSVEARNSFLINDGEISSPIKSMMISGNIFELLKNIDGVGTDVRALGSIITPTIRVSNMKVVGK